MAYDAKVIADSVGPLGVRLTTIEVTLPRIVLAELNTHRAFSRNSASSRAIPVEKMIARVQEDPFVPVYWGKNQKGMQAGEEVGERERAMAGGTWRSARDEAVERVRDLIDLGIHKQIANRLLEPWLWHTVIVTATEWQNFFNLRCHPFAQPEIRVAAERMRAAREASTPRELGAGEWHMPYVSDDERAESKAIGEAVPWERVSVGRCARVSYLTHDGVRDVQKDIDLAESLLVNGHLSPFEHVATPISAHVFGGEPVPFFGNFRGWVQMRKQIPNESAFVPTLPEPAPAKVLA